MLDDRAKLLLKTLVERYITDGQPVGSRTLSQTSGLELSSATIRHVMSDLEAMGLIASPHTSAGRVPTSKGYRLFVDTMLTFDDSVKELSPTPSSIELSTKNPQATLSSAAQLLSSLSHFVGVVAVPRRVAVFKHIEFVALSERRILLILVTPDGDVHNQMIQTAVDYSQDQLTQTAQFFNGHYSGMSIEQVKIALQTEMEHLRSEIADLMKTTVETVEKNQTQDPQENLLIAGESNLLSVSDFSSDLDHLRQMFGLFDQKAQLMQLMTCALDAQGVRIYIGGESQVLPYENLSIVSSPYIVDGQVLGTLGVIGPQRMPYERMVKIVDITSKLLGSTLSGRSCAS